MADSYPVELAKPFNPRFVRDDGRGNSYVPHHTIIQKLILTFGAPPKIEILRELYDEGKLTGVIMRLTVSGLEPVEEAGEADNPQSKTNGARAKDACSDALKRCAMRLGCGLHLWAQDDYILYQQLLGEATPTREGATAGSAAARPGPAPGSPPGWEEN